MGTFKKSKVKSKFKKLQDGGDTKSSPNDDDNWVNDQYYGRNTVAKTPNAGKGPSSDIGERQTGKASETKSPPNKFPEATPPAKKAESFGEAFKRNRAAGAKTFTHNGKSYTTKTKEEAAKKTTPAAAPAAKPSAKPSAPIAKAPSTTPNTKPSAPVEKEKAKYPSGNFVGGLPMSPNIVNKVKNVIKDAGFKSGGKVSKSVKVSSKRKK